MNLDTATLIEKLTTASHVLRQRAAIICFIAFAVVYGFIMVTVSGLTQQEPTEDAIKKELKQVAKPKVDERVADTMLGLEERNVTIQAIFDDARNNPFTE